MRKILFLTALLSNLVFAKDMFIFDIKADLLDPKTKEVVGEIYEGTPVKFIKQNGNLTLIEVNGEVTADNKSVLAYKKDPLITFLTLKDGETKPKARYLVESKKLSDNSYASWEEVELVYYDTCSSCHAAHKPKEHLMNEWDAYLTAMQMFAKISDEEKARILRFMQAFAKDGIAKEED